HPRKGPYGDEGILSIRARRGIRPRTSALRAIEPLTPTGAGPVWPMVVSRHPRRPGSSGTTRRAVASAGGGPELRDVEMSGLESKWSNLFPSRQVHRGARLSPERAVAPNEPHLHFDIRRSRRDDRIISFAHVALPWPRTPGAIAARRSAGRGAA